VTDDLRYERVIGAAPEAVFDAFTSPGGQAAFYGQDDSGWVVRTESEVRVGGVWTIAFGRSIASSATSAATPAADGPQRLTS
jgi:uncharacterized protein YndB with AHSA1/START domain